MPGQIFSAGMDTARRQAHAKPATKTDALWNQELSPHVWQAQSADFVSEKHRKKQKIGVCAAPCPIPAATGLPWHGFHRPNQPVMLMERAETAIKKCKRRQHPTRPIRRFVATRHRQNGRLKYLVKQRRWLGLMRHHNRVWLPHLDIAEQLLPSTFFLRPILIA